MIPKEYIMSTYAPTENAYLNTAISSLICNGNLELASRVLHRSRRSVTETSIFEDAEQHAVDAIAKAAKAPKAKAAPKNDAVKEKEANPSTQEATENAAPSTDVIEAIAVTEEVVDEITEEDKAKSIEDIRVQAEALQTTPDQIVYGMLNGLMRQALSQNSESDNNQLVYTQDGNDYMITSGDLEQHLRIVPNVEYFNTNKDEIASLVKELLSMTATEGTFSSYKSKLKHLRGVYRKLAIKEVTRSEFGDIMKELYQETASAYEGTANEGCAAYVLSTMMNGLDKVLRKSKAPDLVKYLYFIAATVQTSRVLNAALANPTTK